MEGTVPLGHLDINFKKPHFVFNLLMLVVNNSQTNFNANSFNLRMRYSSLYKVKVCRKLSFNHTENSAPVHCT